MSGFDARLVPANNVPRTLFAAGAIAALRSELAALGVARPMLVTDKGLVGTGIAGKVVDAYAGRLGDMVVFDEVTENPLYADVDRGAALYAQQHCDGVVALGGGSVIDTAKLIALLGKNPGKVSDYVGVPNVAHVAAAPLVVIPTTAGTGSEASPSAGIHPDATTASLGMNSRFLVPRVAILDPDMTRSLPTRLVAATGIDALSHCIEGFLSKKSIPLGDSIALDGVARVARHLHRAVKDRGDAGARGEMMLAAFAGGISIGMGLGPAHAVAIACSDRGFHHGMLSGIGIVATLDLTARHVPERVAELSRAFDVDSAAPGAAQGADHAGSSLASKVASLMRDLGLPATLHELGYELTEAQIQSLAESAHKSYFNLASPYHPTVAEYAEMIGRSARKG